MSLVDSWCECQALKQYACKQIQRPALYWQRAPAVLGLKANNAVMGGKRSELVAAFWLWVQLSSSAHLAAGCRSPPPNSSTNGCMAPMALGQASWKIMPACHQNLSYCVWSMAHTPSIHRSMPFRM